MSKKNPLHEIYRCLSEPKSVKLKEFIEDPQSLVGKILDVIPEPGGDFRIKEEVIRVTPKKAYTRMPPIGSKMDSKAEARVTQKLS